MHDWKAIIEAIHEAKRILLFTHMSMDGDAAGSSCALCATLRAMGKDCYVLLEDDCPAYLQFLNEQDYFTEHALWTPDLSIAVDCNDEARLGKRKEMYYSAARTACIDHHEKKAPMAQIEVIDPSAPAAGSLVFELLQAMDAPIDKGIASALYVALATDTGSFRYSNATAGAHEDAVKLYAYGINHAALCDAVWDQYPLAQLKLEALAVDRAMLLLDGKVAISWCTLEDLDALNAKSEHTECCIDRIRSIAGVEVAAFFKERPEGCIKVSFRSKSRVDVNAIANAFGGGGHLRASGCTLYVPMEEAIETLRPVLEQSVAP